ncbi:MAG: phage holin family protein [Clostridium sp.]|nr:phage holin family protein [Clostridium sp.]
MKKFFLEGLLAAPLAGLMAYLGQMELPIIIFALAMLLDLATGLAKACVQRQLCSKLAFAGACKKLAGVAAVFVGAGVDWLLPSVLEGVGISYSPKLIFGLLVVLWLCINEFISVLENLNALGVPFPAFLQRVVNMLKQQVEQNGDKQE